MYTVKSVLASFCFALSLVVLKIGIKSDAQLITINQLIDDNQLYHQLLLFIE